MVRTENNKDFPVLGIQEFSKNRFKVRNQVLFNELHGERHIEEPHQHDFFIIILFDQAKGIHKIDFIDYTIGNKQVHLLFPGQVHTWNIEPRTIGYQLMIDRETFFQFHPQFRFSFAAYQKHPVIELGPESFQLIYYEFDAIKNELQSENPLPELMSSRAAVIASIVSKEAIRVFEDLKIFQVEPRILTFQQLINIHFKEERAISFYAEKLHISANYLNICCKKHLKVSATQLIQQRTILEAKRLLKSTALSVKEIAYKLGFTDHAYFSNFFKVHAGTTPTDFRGQL